MKKFFAALMLFGALYVTATPTATAYYENDPYLQQREAEAEAQRQADEAARQLREQEEYYHQQQ